MTKSSPQTLGKYQILERIASGGMAEIYKARLEGIGGFQRTIAIKRILPNLARNRDYIEMLRDEARVAGQLSHANIVQHIDLREDKGVWFIAMEYVDGCDLGAILRRAGERGLVLPSPHAIFITLELLKGLEYAHTRHVMRGGRRVDLDIVHRDVSPPNILVSYSGEVKLTDFGIAKASLKVMETVSGIVKGRFDYMSPEQASGAKNLDARSDLFAVGVLLYEMLTGVHPFRAPTEIGTVDRLRRGQYDPMHVHTPEVPATLESIVSRALQVDREDRFQSATELKEALDRFFHDAGFYFTHTTLGTYIRGLFPELQRKDLARTRSRGPLTTAQLDDIDLGEAERPTRRMTRSALRDAQTLDQPADTPTTPDDGPLLAPGFHPPSDFEDEVATVLRAPKRTPDDASFPPKVSHTPPPAAKSQRAFPAPHPHPDARSGDTLRSESNASDTIPRPTQPTAPASATTQRRKKKSRLPWMGFVLVPFALGLGFLLGAITTSVVAVWMAGTSARAPSLFIDAPADTKVFVDDMAFVSGASLVPGIHEVRLEHDEGETEITVRLPEGRDVWLVVPH